MDTERDTFKSPLLIVGVFKWVLAVTRHPCPVPPIPAQIEDVVAIVNPIPVSTMASLNEIFCGCHC